MNTKVSPASESLSNSRDNPCFGTETQLTALGVITDNGVSHLLAYAQFLRSERGPNPALERDSSAPPERMRLFFASAEVVLLGSGLQAIERWIQKGDLKFVEAQDRRFARVFKTHIASVTLVFDQEAS